MSDQASPDQQYPANVLVPAGDDNSLREIKLPASILIALLEAAGGSVTIAPGDGTLDDDTEVIQYFRNDPAAVVIKTRTAPDAPAEDEYEVMIDKYGQKRRIYITLDPPKIKRRGTLWRDPEKPEVALEYKLDPAGWVYCPSGGIDLIWRDPDGNKRLSHPYYTGPKDGKDFRPKNVHIGAKPPSNKLDVWQDPETGTELHWFSGSDYRHQQPGWYAKDPWVFMRTEHGYKTANHPRYTTTPPVKPKFI